MYAKRSTLDREVWLQRYRLVDIAHRVVGVGSVGTRAYPALFIANTENDPLFPPIKECVAPAHAPYLAPLPNLCWNKRRSGWSRVSEFCRLPAMSCWEKLLSMAVLFCPPDEEHERRRFPWSASPASRSASTPRFAGPCCPGPMPALTTLPPSPVTAVSLLCSTRRW